MILSSLWTRITDGERPERGSLTLAGEGGPIGAVTECFMRELQQRLEESLVRFLVLRLTVAAKACDYIPVGNDDAPVGNVSWNDTQQFIEWLSNVTQKKYRLPSEAEWEYAARGGTQTRYWWGDQLQSDMANCRGCGGAYDPSQPLKVGSFKPNPFGLHDMGGSVGQWVEDCWHKDYQGAPIDGSAWIDKNCAARVIRSGSWKNDASYIRPASRDRYDTGVRYPTHGFRVVATP